MVLEALWSDHEVEERDLCGEFGEVVWVAEFGCDVEPEVAGVFDGVVTEFDTPDTAWEGWAGERGGCLSLSHTHTHTHTHVDQTDIFS